ncbi:MAG: hypothetical protein LIP00_01575 [Parabacteroides sp.]|nr:hypothetical protein [Parabacteroides sp.]
MTAYGGPLHNKSVKPRVEISNARLTDKELAFTIYRVEGTDVYGSFLIGISLQNGQRETVFRKGADEPALFPEQQIQNRYIAQVKPGGAYSLVLPLGGKAELVLYAPEITGLPEGNYTLILTDVSGTTWEEKIVK